MKLCVYGTVYNNASYVEESIKSVWRPDAELTVVDSYSNDGTWEKLVELKKDYNLKIYRYKCSRGLGRHIALLKCPENSITSYFDLDTIYNENFHKAIEAAEIYGSIKYNRGLVVNREVAIKRGGWKDLNSAEDTEFSVRINPNVFVPVEAGKNASLHLHGFMREKRYSVGVGYVKRLLQFHKDYVSGAGLDLLDVINFRSKRLILLSLFLLPWLFKNHRVMKKINNLILENIMFLIRLNDPKVLNMDERLFFLGFNYKVFNTVKNGNKTIEEIISNRVHGRLYKITTSSRFFYMVYVKDFMVLNNYQMILPIIKEISVV